MPFNSFVRKDRHRWVPTGLGLRQRYRRIDLLLTTIPSLRSSPRMRSLPQRGFYVDMSRMSSRTSGLSHVGGRAEL